MKIAPTAPINATVLQIALAVAATMVLSTAAHAAPPLTTDDASTLSPGMCQLETELRRFRKRDELDVVPACNFLFDAEIGIGKLRVAPDVGLRADSVVFRFKKVISLSDAPDWSFGIGAATIRATGGESGTRQNLVNALISRQLGSTLLHLNLGNVSDREAAPGARRNRLFWGLAAEREASERWTLLGEVYGQKGLPETAQLGLRWWALPKYVQLTSSVGAQRGQGRDGRWFSFGVRLESGGPAS
ncbi:MAG: hypothetical protein JNN20_14945 [Betaproteobacteria bacterium]|nr:hypothetical protein [Betaproteobacteria bacterium]